MCDRCDDPDLVPSEYLRQVREHLRGCCFIVQSVGGSAASPEFSYTVGLTAHGLAELIVFGRRPDDAVRLLQSWGDYVLDQSLVLPGERLGSGSLLMEAVEVDRPEEHLLTAVALYGPAVRATQLVWADARGRWPWEPGHRARRAGQPVLGERAPWYCPEHRPDRLDVPPYLDGTS